jgi:ElaB/YqjD/DUF883 family membrane-anchored ribosome-binding protein
MSTQLETGTKGSADHTSQLGSDVKRIRRATKRLAADSVDVARQTASGLIEDARTKARKAVASAQGKVQEKPVKIALAAAAVGFLLGLFWRRH